MVNRPRVRQALAAGRGGGLTLVAAPAGYGKTTAVRAWCSSLDSALAWVTLDAGDDDPARFWSYLASAVDRIRPGLGRSALRRLGVPGAPVEHAVDELMNGIGAFDRGLVVVLDDLQAVTSTECLATLDHALSHLPSTARLIAVTRADPALRLAAYRASGRLAEVRARELAFTSAEARELLVTRTGIDLGPEEIEVLLQRTEGWPAALVLAGAWLRTVDDPRDAVGHFGGDHRFVAEYLGSEVLASLSDDRRSLLEGASILGYLTAELADAVLDRTDSATGLAELARADLCVARLERGGWYRVHSLLAEYAVAELSVSNPGAAARIHRRAAEWLRARSLPIEAIRQATAAGDDELAALLLAESHLALIRSGGSRAVLQSALVLPDAVLVEHPELAAAAAVAAVLVGGRTVEMRRLLELVERGRDPRAELVPLYVEVGRLIARALSIEGGAAESVLDGRRAVELAEGAPIPELLPGALAALARALYFVGELDGASEVARSALERRELERAVPSLVASRSTLALVAVERGELASARRHADRAKAAVGRIGTTRSWLGANVSAALGAVLAAEGSLAEAERQLATAESFFTDEAATLHEAWVLVLLARVRLGRGRLDEAETSLRAGQRILADLADGGFVPELADVVARDLDAARARADLGEVLEPPSAAELAVLRLLATDLSSREIGERLFLSPNTIRTHTRALYHKLGVHSRSDAIARAAALGLLEQPESPG